MQAFFELLLNNAGLIATLLAIVIGPIVAVYITRSLDNRRAERERNTTF